MTSYLRYIYATACLLVSASAIHAEDKIEGAFGKKLGATFSASDSIGKGALTDGTTMYRFQPESPFRSLTEYYVLTTPSTNRIYCIWAQGPTENTASAKKEQAVLMELLQQKYGQAQRPGAFDAMTDLKQISQGSRYIVTKVTGFVKPMLEVRYYDSELSKAAEQERLSIEAKKASSSGL